MRRRGVAGVGAIGVVAALGALGLASGGLSALSTALTTENTEGRENTGGVAWARALTSAPTTSMRYFTAGIHASGAWRCELAA